MNYTEAIQNACEVARQDERRKFKEYLNKRLKEYRDSIHTEIDEYDLGYMDAIKEVINEFIGE